MTANGRPPAPRTALSLAEAAESLGISPDAFAEHVLPHVGVLRIGRRKLVPLRALEEWANEHAEPPMAEQLGRRRRA